MLKIGDFSKLSFVSIRMLRYYDEMDLLKPLQVDDFTGYRYYAAHQLARLNRILALRDMGLSVEQIRQLLSTNLNPEQIQGMLKLKQVELIQQVAESQERLHRIENWLEQFEQEDKMPEYDVVIKKVEPILVAEKHGTTPTWDVIGPTLDRLFDDIADYLIEQGLKNGEFGPGITSYYDKEYRESDIQLGAAFPIKRRIPTSDSIKVYDLPGHETVASIIHNGSFSGLHAAYKAISEWIETHGYQIIGPNREINLEYERGGDQSKYVTEIQFPVAKAN